MNKDRFSRLFPLGSHLCREPMPPMSELKHDMEILRRSGFNLVKLQENWAIDEPSEGAIDLSRYEELIKHAADLDMGVYIGFTCEQAPGWLWKKYPDCCMVGRNGQPIIYQAQTTLPADGKPGPCWDHPGARHEMTRFLTAAVQILGRYENVVVWNSWQEVGYWAEMLVGQPVCYCEHTLTFFREWLQGLYQDLDSLNKAWGSRYADWKDVQPDRGGYGRQALPHDVAWRTFMENAQVARVLETRAQAIRAADPLQRPVLAHRSSPAIGSTQDWTLARCQDFLGSSLYPAWGATGAWDDSHPSNGSRHSRQEALVGEMWEGVALKMDYIRCCNLPGAPIWAAEMQGGPISTGFHRGRIPDEADIRRWMLTMAASGGTGINFWVTRAEIMAAESNGFSLLDSEGDSTPRFEEAARIGMAFNRFPELFGQPNWPQPSVGILVNEGSYQFCASMTQGGEHLSYSVRGWHRILWEGGIPADFVSLTDDAERLEQYPVLILPFPLSLSEKLAERLCSYVRSGGTLICEPSPGRINEHGFCVRGELSPVLRALIGIDVESHISVREPDDGMRWSMPERTWGEYRDLAYLEGLGQLEGQRLLPNVLIETYFCREAEPCLLYGDQVAGVVRNVGKGKIWLIGTVMGHGGTAYRNDPSLWTLLTILQLSTIVPDRVGSLLRRRRVCGSLEAWFLTNPSNEKVRERIDLPAGVDIEDLLGESLMRYDDTALLDVEGLDVRLLLVRHGE